jgi:hypothetical protein
MFMLFFAAQSSEVCWLPPKFNVAEEKNPACDTPPTDINVYNLLFVTSLKSSTLLLVFLEVTANNTL